MLLKNVPAQIRKTYPSRERQNCTKLNIFEPSIHSKGSTLRAANHPFLQSPARWAPNASHLLRCKLVVTVFEDFIEQFQNLSAESQEDA